MQQLALEKQQVKLSRMAHHNHLQMNQSLLIIHISLPQLFIVLNYNWYNPYSVISVDFSTTNATLHTQLPGGFSNKINFVRSWESFGVDYLIQNLNRFVFYVIVEKE